MSRSNDGGSTRPLSRFKQEDTAAAEWKPSGIRGTRSKPRHLVPQPKALLASRAGLDGLIDSLLGAQQVLEMFRRTLPNGITRRRLDRLSNRLTKILSEARKLPTP